MSTTCETCDGTGCQTVQTMIVRYGEKPRHESPARITCVWCNGTGRTITGQLCEMQDYPLKERTMKDKNDRTIYYGDYVVGITDSGEVRDGIVTSKYPEQMTIRIMDDNGEDAWLKSYRAEVQPEEIEEFTVTS